MLVWAMAIEHTVLRSGVLQLLSDFETTSELFESFLEMSLWPSACTIEIQPTQHVSLNWRKKEPRILTINYIYAFSSEQDLPRFDRNHPPTPLRVLSSSDVSQRALVPSLLLLTRPFRSHAAIISTIHFVLLVCCTKIFSQAGSNPALKPIICERGYSLCASWPCAASRKSKICLPAHVVYSQYPNMRVNRDLALLSSARVFEYACIISARFCRSFACKSFQRNACRFRISTSKKGF